MNTANNTPLIVAGPCSAETESQMMRTAAALAADPRIKVFRAGLWKPRTEPGSFAGVGEKGLPWLQKVQREFGLQVTTEVANKAHVRAALEAGIDILWIGARSTTNPFTVQEIAEALEGHKVPVMIKNPVSPDPRLWIGAVRRMQKVGIEDITLIHRGFTPFRPGRYRNEPRWEIVEQVRKELPDLKMICDPSHIAGDRAKVAEICRKATELGLDGLMVESHPDPDQAWSDAKQQVTPDQLLQLLDELESVEARPLNRLREEVDLLDQHLMELIAARMSVVKQIGAVKNGLGMDVVQETRWHHVLKRGLENGQHLGLSQEFVQQYLEAIHRESIATQRKMG